VLDLAMDALISSAVTAEIGTSRAPVWRHARGRLSRADTDAPVREDTIFDLASLTKVLATAAIGARLIAQARLNLDDRVALLVPAWATPDRATVTVRDILEHCSGLPGHRPYFTAISGRGAYEVAIAREPLEYVPGSRALYSDLGFILLGFILEDAGGAALDALFRDWVRSEGLSEEIGFVPSADWRTRTASTGPDPWRGRVLQGEVHDANAAALGGVAGHAGLFGTAAAVGEIARWWLARLGTRSTSGLPSDRGWDVIASFARRSIVPGSSRALGWDTMLPTSSCGTRWSTRAIGHTGFTGTSLWIDPERDLYAVLLTNYVESARERETLNSMRRAFHDAVVDDHTGGQP
jgi:CubicO group peptidase (beta-lactamase class C family)